MTVSNTDKLSTPGLKDVVDFLFDPRGRRSLKLYADCLGSDMATKERLKPILNFEVQT